MKKILIFLFLFFWIINISFATVSNYTDYNASSIDFIENTLKTTWYTINYPNGDEIVVYINSGKVWYTKNWWSLVLPSQSLVYGCINSYGDSNACYIVAYENATWQNILTWFWATTWTHTISSEMFNMTTETRIWGASVSDDKFWYDGNSNYVIYNTYKKLLDDPYTWTYPVWWASQNDGAYIWGFWPPPLEFVEIGEITPIQDGFILSGSIINQDYKITNIDIYKYEAWTPLMLDNDARIVNITWSWGVEVELDILNDEDFTFSSFNDYEIKITFKNIDETESIYNFYTYWIYVYNEWYIEPDPNDFYYSATQFYSFENWFFYNSIPDPYWWEFFFELIAPDPSWTGTINVTTEKYWPYNTDGNGYGVDGWIVVTYPYHPVSWTYQIRVVYEYDNVIDYPYWEHYDAYEITLAERRLTATELEEELTFLYICDTDEDGITSTGEALACPFNVLKYYTSKVYTFFENIYNLLEKIGSAFTTEVKTFSFIWTTHAESNDIMTGFNNSVNQEEYDSTFFWKLTIFIKWFVAFMVFLIWLLVYLALTRKKW